MRSKIIAAFLFPALALARTDLSGCTSSIAGPSLIWYVPGSCELCEIPDCGGGRAPPKTDNPACANYQGTATYTPSFLSGCGGAAATTTGEVAGGPKSAGAGPTTSPAITGAASGSGSAVTSTVTLVAANSTATSVTSVSSFSNSSVAAATSAAAFTTESASSSAVVTPSSPSTAASSSSTGAAGIMTVGMNMGGLIMAAGVGAMAML